MATALGSGFALAVRPVSADTIITPSDGLDVDEVQIPTASGDIPAYRAWPAGKGKKTYPVVLVIQEIFGVHEHIKDLCRRLAQRGYFAVAPSLFARQGDVTKMAEFKDIISHVVSKVPDAQVMSDLDATVAWAKTTGKANVAKLAITGFCWGGRITWLYAAHNPAVRAGVAWYGRLVGDKDEMKPQHPVDVAASLKAPVLGLYGAEDGGIPLQSIEQMRQALATGKAAAKRSKIHVYEGAGHAFLADYRPSYKAEAAQDGWAKMLAWFKQNGVA